MPKYIYMWHQNHTWGADALVGVQFKELSVAFCLLFELPKRESHFIYIGLLISLFVIVQ